MRSGLYTVYGAPSPTTFPYTTLFRSYRPVNDPEDPATIDRDQTQAILDAVDELEYEADGDILVFLSGEREIRDTADALTDKFRDRKSTRLNSSHVEISYAVFCLK